MLDLEKMSSTELSRFLDRRPCSNMEVHLQKAAREILEQRGKGPTCSTFEQRPTFKHGTITGGPVGPEVLVDLDGAKTPGEVLILDLYENPNVGPWYGVPRERVTLEGETLRF